MAGVAVGRGRLFDSAEEFRPYPEDHSKSMKVFKQRKRKGRFVQQTGHCGFRMEVGSPAGSF